MLIYKDRFTGDEMLSDVYPIKVASGGMVFEVTGKMTTEVTEITDNMIGGNASAEGGGEDAEAASESGCNIVLANKLREIHFDNKKDFGTQLKSYCKRLLTALEEEDAERAAEFKKTMPNIVKSILANFANWQFFVGENLEHNDGMIALLDFREDGITPYMLFFKDGLIEEKV